MKDDRILQVKNLHKRFGGVHAVNDVSLELNRGELLGLIGPNGSGKSTMVNLIGGIYSPDSGEILFEGKSVRKDSVAKRAKKGIARTFQTPKPFVGMTVYKSVFTVALQKGSFEQAHQKTEEVLKAADLFDLQDVLSEKLPIEKRKWLDLARILTLDPKVIMLDEVMAGLNPGEMEESMALIRRINEMGISIILIEHVMRAISALCHRIVVLADGMVLCEGTPEEVLNNPEVVKAYLGNRSL